MKTIEEVIKECGWGHQESIPIHYVKQIAHIYADQFKPKNEVKHIDLLSDLRLDKIHFTPIIQNWLSYKSQKRQAYKPIGLKTLIKKFNEFEGSYSELESIVENSIMNNYSGIIWKLNNTTNGKQPKPTREEAINSFLND